MYVYVGVPLKMHSFTKHTHKRKDTYITKNNNNKQTKTL